MRFSDNVLSRSQMKSVKGGYGEEASTCTKRCPKPYDNVTCNGNGCITFNWDGGGCSSVTETYYCSPAT
jgi:hypothetical protein